MNEQRIMSVRAIAALVTVGVLSFIGYVYFSSVHDDINPPRSYQADGYSRSAIGHVAFMRFAEKLGIPVTQARQFTEAVVGWNGLLVMAEPLLGERMRKQVVTKAKRTRSLVVLPKRRGKPDRAHGDFVRAVGRVSGAATAQLVTELVPGASVVHLADAATFRHNDGTFTPTLQAPQLFQPGKKSGNVTPLLYNSDGVLLAEVSSGLGRFYILSDPDLLANHGLKDGENARIMAWVLEQVVPGGGRMVFDEVIHGHQARPNLWVLLFSPPYVIVTLLFFITLVLLVWIGLSRFGKPAADRPILARGTRSLINNTAEMLAFSGRGNEVLSRYLENARRDVAVALHAPRDLAADGLDAWLDQIATNRNLDIRLYELADDVARATTVKLPLAQQLRLGIRIYTWKTELIHGSG